MQQTQLTGRQIMMVVLSAVILMGGMLAYVFTVLPSNDDPVGFRRLAIASGVFAVFAAVWFVKLVIDSIRDRRLGIRCGAARVSGRFNLWFGATVAAGGIAGSALTYWSAVSAGGGTWTLYYGMIGWGILQMFFGWRRLAIERNDGSVPPDSRSTG